MKKDFVYDDFSNSNYRYINNRIYMHRTFKIEGDHRQIMDMIKNSQSIYLKNIVDIDYINGYTEYYEEYIDGSPLSKVDFNILNNQQINDIMLQTLYAVRDLHNSNIIHRDIKPDNIIIDKKSNITLIDYDVARVKNLNNRDTTLLGTEEYASPEHFGFGQTTFVSDIYSFGKTFIELLPENNNFENILKRCTQVDQKKRYKNVDELIDAIKDCSVKKKKEIIPWWFNITINTLIMLLITVSINQENIIEFNTSSTGLALSTSILLTNIINKPLRKFSRLIVYAIRIIYAVLAFFAFMFILVVIDLVLQLIF